MRWSRKRDSDVQIQKSRFIILYTSIDRQTTEHAARLSAPLASAFHFPTCVPDKEHGIQ